MYINKRVAILFMFLVILFLFFFTKQETFQTKPTGLNRLDAIIYINLDHRKDRKKQIEEELKKAGVEKKKIIRFPAVYEKLNGHLGCVKSHIGVMKLIKNSNFKNALILEDDFQFEISKNETNTKIDRFLDKFKNNWDAIHLSRSWWSKDKKINDDICKIKTVMTASGYIVNNNNDFYDNLLKDFQDSEHELTLNFEKWKKNNPNKKKYTDSAALNQHWFKLQEKSKWYIFDPILGKQRGSPSSIMGSANNNKKDYK